MNRWLPWMLLLWPLLLGAAPDSPERLLQRMEQSRQDDARQRQEREARFLAGQGDRKALLEALRQRVAEERARGEALKERFTARETELTALQETLRQQSGDLGEVFGTVRQTAREMAAQLEESMVSAQWPERGQWLAALGESRRLPLLADLEELGRILQRELVASGQVARFPALVVAEGGQTRRQEVVRVGLFGAVTADRYLRYLPGEHRFAVLPRQPGASDLELAATFFQTREGQARLAIDPTRGVLMALLMETPELADRVRQGGAVGHLILLLGGVGLLLGVGRLGYLTRVGKRVARQLEDPDHPTPDNPLGRVLGVARGRSREQRHNVELLVDEAVLREIPRLTRGERLMKLLASVAPLLGLLGTVTGMIVTFQAISLFGGGDPKLMADGISQALVTTAEGLMVAVPLLFLHALVAARSRALVRILDQQAMGIVALAWEQGR